MDQMMIPTTRAASPSGFELIEMFDHLPIALHHVNLSEVRHTVRQLNLDPESLLQTLRADARLTTKVLEKIEFVSANQAAVSIIDAKDKQEVLARFRETITPGATDAILEALVSCWQTGFGEFRTQIKTLKGKSIDVRVCITIDRNERHSWRRAYVATSLLAPEDLTHRLSQMHEIFDAVLDGIDMCVSHLTLDGKFLSSVGALLRRFNLADHELVGQNIFDIYPAELADDIRRGLAGEHIQFLDSASLRQETGEEWYVSSYFLPAGDSGTYLVSFDVTDLRVSQRKLEEQAKELQQSHDELTQFAQVVSHDLREPVRSISLFTELLADHLGEKIDEKARHYLDTIAANAERMGQLIADLSHYNHIRPLDNLQPVDLGEAASKAISHLASAVAETGAIVDVEHLPKVRALETWCILLFQNLLANAIKYRGKAAPNIRVWSEMQDGETVVFVRDNGIGISPEYHDRIFEIFRRLHSRDQFPGTGMGLAICKKIVTQLGGRIWVDSAEGQGSTFAFTIPHTQH